MSSETAAATQTMQVAPEPQVKILIVDDQPENLVALEAVLESLGQHIVQASSGREALRCCLDHDFAAILLDVKMPDMDGFEAAAMIRERERSKNTPIIFLTALKSEEHLFRGYYMGAVDYLYKPIVPEVLKSKVAVFVDLSKKNALLKQHTEVLEQKNRELQQLITERTKAEEHVRLLNTELEERVQERTLELSRMNEELRQFAYVASHDLQEPLRTVGSYAQLLAKRYKGRLEPEADEFIHFMVDGVTRMHVLLNDMLAYSRVTDSSARPLKPVDLQGTLNGALMNLEASIKDTDAKVTCDKMPVVLADDVQLTQVFQNLISNAIKYRTAETPQVHVTAELDSSDWWKIGVADNGIGIDPKYHERVFGLFKRLHGKELPGTGMGLAICKKIVERHGGRIWIESDGSSSGSRFYFTLPPV